MHILTPQTPVPSAFEQSQTPGRRAAASARHPLILGGLSGVAQNVDYLRRSSTWELGEVIKYDRWCRRAPPARLESPAMIPVEGGNNPRLAMPMLIMSSMEASSERARRVVLGF